MGYKELADRLIEDIRSGILAPNARLKAERELAVEMGVARLTLRRALELLEGQGYIQRRGSLGTFVAHRRGGLVAVGFGNALGARLVEGFLSVLGREEGERLVRLDGIVPDDAGHLALPALSDLVARDVGGLALMPEWFGDGAELREIRRSIPIVLMDRRIHGFESDFVGFEDREGGRIAARHLLGLGHRRLAFVGVTVHETAIERSEGVQDVLRDSGLELAWPWMMTRMGLQHWPVEIFDEMMGRDDRPTAVVCSNDINAMKLISLAQRSGYRVPGDLAVVGFGDDDKRVLDAIGLTTVRLPYRDMAALACTLLVKRMTEVVRVEEIRERRVPLQLTIRTSCGNSARA